MDQEADLVETALPRDEAASHGPTLPESIIARIIDYDADDQPRLAEYMTVSSAFNFAVAPKLYKVLRFSIRRLPSAGYSWPLHRDSSPTASSLVRISTTPDGNTKFTQGVVLGSHSPSDCSAAIHPIADLVAKHLKPSWVRFRLDNWDCKTHNEQTLITNLRESCPVVDLLNPVKLVFTETRFAQPLPLYQRVPRSVTTLVSVMTCFGYSYFFPMEDPDPRYERDSEVYRDRSQYLDVIGLDSLTAVQHMVYIFKPRDCLSALETDEDDLLVAIGDFCTWLVETARHMRPKKVTVVNTACVDLCYDETEAAEDRLDKMIERAWETLDPKSPKPAVPRPPVALELLSMEEYLEQCDWSSDFDRDEVVSWLDQDVRARLIATREEELHRRRMYAEEIEWSD